jgi:glutamate dehydrogenase
VLAGLALSDEEHTALMTFPDGSPTEFYRNYVRDVQTRIGENASLEFSCIWKEHLRLAGSKTASPRALLSDLLSESINTLTTVGFRVVNLTNLRVDDCAILGPGN